MKLVAGCPNAIAWCPAETHLLAIGTTDGQIVLYDSADRSVVAGWEAHTADVAAVAWTPDGSLIASGSRIGEVRLWRSDDLSLELELTGPSRTLTHLGHLEWSHDAAWIAAAGWRAIRIWDQSGVASSEYHFTEVDEMSWRRDQAQLLVTSIEDGVLLIDPASKTTSFPLGRDRSCGKHAWDPTGHLVAGTNSRSVWLWDMASGLDVLTIECPQQIFGLTWSHDGSHVVGSSNDNHLWLWNSETGALTATLDAPHAPTWVWSPDRTQVAALSGNRTSPGPLRVRDPIEPLAAQGDDSAAAPHGTIVDGLESVGRVAWTPDGTTIVTSGSEVRCWDAESGQPRTLDPALKAPMRQTEAHSADGRQVVSFFHKTVHVADLFTREVSEFEGHEKTVTCAAWSPDGSSVASASRAELIVWDLATGTLRQINVMPGLPNAIAWAPDGSVLAVGGDRSLMICDGVSGELIEHRRYASLSDVTRTLAWSPDGTRIASGGYEGVIRLWHIDLPDPVVAIDAGITYSLAWSPDGSRIASSGTGALTVWGAESGERICRAPVPLAEQ